MTLRMAGWSDGINSEAIDLSDGAVTRSREMAKGTGYPDLLTLYRSRCDFLGVRYGFRDRPSESTPSGGEKGRVAERSEKPRLSIRVPATTGAVDAPRNPTVFRTANAGTATLSATSFGTYWKRPLWETNPVTIRTTSRRLPQSMKETVTEKSWGSTPSMSL